MDTTTRKRRRIILTVLSGLLLLLVIGLLVRPSGDTTAPAKVDTPATTAPAPAPHTPQVVTDLPVDAERGMMLDISALTHIEATTGTRSTSQWTTPPKLPVRLSGSLQGVGTGW